MRAKSSLVVMFVCILLVLAVAVGCSKKPNDAQIIGEIAQKIQGDPNIQVKAIAVQSTDGVVTLSGVVNTDMERSAAANDAGQVQGVRTMVNNLAVQQAAATPLPAVPVAEAPKSEPVKTSARHSSAKSNSHSRSNSNNDYVPPADTVSQMTPAPAPVVSTPAMPPPKPKPATVTIPDGTELSIRLIDPLDSDKNQVRDSFRATLNHSVPIGEQTAIPAGADVMGRVVDVKGATHFSGQSVLAVELVSISMGGK